MAFRTASTLLFAGVPVASEEIASLPVSKDGDCPPIAARAFTVPLPLTGPRAPVLIDKTKPLPVWLVVAWALMLPLTPVAAVNASAVPGRVELDPPVATALAVIDVPVAVDSHLHSPQLPRRCQLHLGPRQLRLLN